MARLYPTIGAFSDRCNNGHRLAESCVGATFSASSRFFDLNGETKRVSKKQSSAIIAADVRRFSYLINTDDVFGTHNSRTANERYREGYSSGRHAPARLANGGIKSFPN